MARTIYAWAPIGGVYRVAARLAWEDNELGRFLYSPEWTSLSGAYPLDPINLPFSGAEKVIRDNHGIPGVMADAGPDSWGRSIIVQAGTAVPRTEAEWVLHPNAVGTGALRFSESAANRPSTTDSYPTCTLEQLYELAMTVATGGTIDPPLRHLLQHMSSPGGARPKALMMDGGKEHIAKFEKPNDSFNVPRVEAACLKAADLCGIRSAPARVIEIRPSTTALLVERFDRTSAGQPIHYLSGRSLLNIWRVRAGRDDMPPAGVSTYQALAAAARQIGIEGAGEEVLRRMTFNYLIGNTDDHLQNIGFLYEEGAWRFAPAFDLLPHTGDIHAIGIGPQGRQRNLGNLTDGALMFGLSDEDVERIVTEAIDGVKKLDELMIAEGVSARDRDIVMARMSRMVTADVELDLGAP